MAKALLDTDILSEYLKVVGMDRCNLFVLVKSGDGLFQLAGGGFEFQAVPQPLSRQTPGSKAPYWNCPTV